MAKIYFDCETNEWHGGAWLDRLHSAGYSISAASFKFPPEAAVYIVIKMDEEDKPRQVLTELLTEHELQLYITCLIGGADGDSV